MSDLILLGRAYDVNCSLQIFPLEIIHMILDQVGPRFTYDKECYRNLYLCKKDRRNHAPRDWPEIGVGTETALCKNRSSLFFYRCKFCHLEFKYSKCYTAYCWMGQESSESVFQGSKQVFMRDLYHHHKTCKSKPKIK